ncbi:hypothetical protein TRICI_000314 [Trichomonascus ciferrii]|uniref:Metallo-beta-lactamase domain-containing protein n=1 Tax=Trichomonascus ciferrii TaxID=44093 RepID=A0A642VDQ8_9ASCO|nr:hypothetical protein TRICI_000314 [Trichomonascus ciferrii]
MDLLICTTCGTQHEATSLTTCRICDDPRQFVPPTGPSFTTLRTLVESKKYRNEVRMDPYNSNMYSIWTEPTFAIGQRAILLRSPKGNVLWDCISYIDQETVSAIKKLGGISAIVISHPHFYSCHLEWAKLFDCPVYLATADQEWRSRRNVAVQQDVVDRLSLCEGEFTAVQVGGHFPGSMVLHWQNKLLTADSIMVVPSGMYDIDRQEGTASFSFMWSYPNMIPLDPESIHGIWKNVESLEFDDCHSAWWGRDVRGNARKKVLKSAQISVKSMGHTSHQILSLK